MFTLLLVQNQNGKLWLPVDISMIILDVLHEMTTKDIMSESPNINKYTCISCLIETAEEVYITQLDNNIVFWKYNMEPDGFEEYRFQHSITRKKFENSYGQFRYNSKCFHCLDKIIRNEKLYLAQCIRANVSVRSIRF